MTWSQLLHLGSSVLTESAASSRAVPAAGQTPLLQPSHWQKSCLPEGSGHGQQYRTQYTSVTSTKGYKTQGFSLNPGIKALITKEQWGWTRHFHGSLPATKLWCCYDVQHVLTPFEKARLCHEQFYATSGFSWAAIRVTCGWKLNQTEICETAVQWPKKQHVIECCSKDTDKWEAITRKSCICGRNQLLAST